jgi:hypothetical protein
LNVERVNNSTIPSLKGIVWNTVHRWTEREGDSCLRFNEKNIEENDEIEWEADQTRAFVGGKQNSKRRFWN